MKTTLLIALFCMTSLVGLAATPTADRVLSDAQAKAAKEDKAIFLRFGASWCPWCQRLEKWLERPDVKPIIGNHFISVKFVIREKGDKKVLENPGADLVLKQLGGEGAGIPYMAFLDAKGNLIVSTMRPIGDGRTKNIAYPNDLERVNWFIEMLKKAAPSISNADLAIIKTSFQL